MASAVGEGSVAVQLLHSLFAAGRLHPRGRPREHASVASNRAEAIKRAQAAGLGG